MNYSYYQQELLET